MTYSELIEGYNPAFYMEGFEVPSEGTVIPGTLGIPVESVTGPVTQAEDGLHFYDAYVSFPYKTFPRHTWSFWIKYDVGETNRWGVFHGERGSYDYRFGTWFDNNSTLWYQNVIESNFFTTYFTRGQWTNVVIVADGSQYSRIYVNGVQRKYQRDSSNYRFGNTVTNTALTIGTGGSPSAGDGFMLRGTLSGFAMLPVQLSAVQVAALYNAGPPVPPAPTESWTVLEAGTEVPVEIEGEYTTGGITPLNIEGIYREATPGTEAHTLVTGADFYHEYGASREPVTTEYVRSNRDATSYSVWAKWDGAPTAPAGVITHQPGATFGSSNNNIYMQSNGIVTLGGGGDTTSVNISPHFTDGQWHHYALVAFVGKRYFYADGVQEAVVNIPTTATVLNTVRFGSMFNGTTEYPLNGLVSDCAVISAYLPPASVTDIYNAGRGTAIPAHVEPL